jgi:hypothetical protein
LYADLLARLSAFGTDVETHAATRNRVFTAGLTFAEIQPLSNALRILIRPEGLGRPESGSAEVHGVTVRRAPDRHGWALNHRIDVDQETPLAGVVALVRESYQAVRRLSER